MIFQQHVKWFLACLSAFLFLFSVAAYAQTNLLLNPNAEEGANNWRVDGRANVEEFNGENVFVIRRDGSSSSGGFAQDVSLSALDVGKYALLIGNGFSERINSDGAITGLPNLYGYMMESINSKGGRINAYLQGQRMLARPVKKDQWVTMFGIFRIPKGTVGIRFFLHQAERKGVPLNGSAARFDNVGLFLFK